ncbi:S-layer homology domain-containing protein [Bacillus sp. CGMCC 1.16541]|uniref:S-layer homology domain-containing protein n=1 Tax=Bacillus sp. CGMCC 1.16541 TaxID=2185143 RepID=UPI0013A562C3|nr:S-layer homology domain-containing protein [Bacillus sp. CGMCC 1.16541]
MFKKKFKKFVATTVAALVVTGSALPFSASAQESSFSDVAVNNSHYEAIETLADWGIITGYNDGTFRPNLAINRGQTAKMISRVYEDEGLMKQVFADVPVNLTDKELVKAAYLMNDYGIMTGTTVGSAKYLYPGKQISRQQMAKVLVLAFELDHVPGETSTVKDLNKAIPEFREYINILSENGVTVVDNFNPTGTVSRAQFASFVYRALIAGGYVEFED